MSSERPLLPETPAVHEVRLAVRRWVADHGRSVAVGLSGGADSSALTVAAVAEADSVHAVVVDHGLQPGSADVAARAAAFARSAGCTSVQVVRVVVTGPGGPEAAARAARYRALDEARGGLPVLLGHTLDDQAETVLLGLGRGSGARSLRGMCEFDEPWGRPLLGVRRDVTRRACAELGYLPYEDAHNSDRRFTRVRLRAEVLPLLEDVLGGGVAPALARTAAQLREDEDALEELARHRLGEARAGAGLAVDVLAGAPVAVRRRVLRRWLLDSGASAPTDRKLRAVDDLIGQWRGQGAVAVGGGPQPGVRLVVTRRRGRLIVEFVGRRQGADD